MFKPRRSSSDYHWIRVPTRDARPAAGSVETQLSAPSPNAAGISNVKVPDPLSRLSFAGALATIGVPGTNKKPEDELVDLLQNAAEIEHGLMLQYLYATYSLKVLLISGMVRTIAIEEMGHFITVQNLLAACGAEPYFGHTASSGNTFFQPFPFRLEPASVGSLAKYTVAEMPDQANVPLGIQPDLPALIAEADAAAGTAVETHRVGLLYAKIYWLLRQNDDPLPDPGNEPWAGFPVAAMAAKPELRGFHVPDGFVTDVHDVNALAAQWRGNYTSVIVDPITGRDAALHAVAKISAQGEGFGDTPQGHFERFVEAWRLAKASTDLALPMPVNPFYATDEGPNGTGDEITSADGRQFARMGDRLYELVLLCTAANLLLPAGTAPAIRTKPAKAAVSTMRDCLSTVAGALSTIPIADQNAGGRVCGLPFGVAPVEVASNLKAVLDRAREVIAGLHEIIGEIDQGNATTTLKAVADGIGTTLDEQVASRLDSLPT